jgi:hypothetical protein
MKLLTKIVLPIAAATGLCAPAVATAFNITLSGTIASGADDRGLFLPAHSSLAGQAFTINYALDAQSMTTTTDSDGVSPIYQFDTPGTMTISVTINGQTFTFHGSAQSFYQKIDHAAQDGDPAFSTVDFKTYDGLNSLSESATADNAPLGPLALFPAGALAHSSLNLSLFNGAVRASSVDSGTISISAVPETSSWLLMLFGFGAIGVAMRSNRIRGAFARQSD